MVRDVLRANRTRSRSLTLNILPQFEGKKRISAEESMSHCYFGNLGRRVRTLADSKTAAPCPAVSRAATSPSDPLSFQPRPSSACRRSSWKKKQSDRRCPPTQVTHSRPFVLSEVKKANSCCL